MENRCDEFIYACYFDSVQYEGRVVQRFHHYSHNYENAEAQLKKLIDRPFVTRVWIDVEKLGEAEAVDTVCRWTREHGWEIV